MYIYVCVCVCVCVTRLDRVERKAKQRVGDICKYRKITVSFAEEPYNSIGLFCRRAPSQRVGDICSGGGDTSKATRILGNTNSMSYKCASFAIRYLNITAKEARL